MGALSSSGARVAFGPAVPERTSPVPLAEIDELGALLESASRSDGGVACGPGAAGPGVLPGRAVAPAVGVGLAGVAVGDTVGRGVGDGVGVGIGVGDGVGVG